MERAMRLYDPSKNMQQAGEHTTSVNRPPSLQLKLRQEDIVHLTPAGDDLQFYG